MKDNRIIEINELEWQKQINSKKAFIILIYAHFVPDCNKIAKTLRETIFNKHPIHIYLVDADKNISLLQKYKVCYIPALLFFRNGHRFVFEGKEKDNGNLIGLFSGAALEEYIEIFLKRKSKLIKQA